MYALSALCAVAAVSASLYLGRQLLETHAASVRANQVWTTRLAMYANLRELALDVTRPVSTASLLRDTEGAGASMRAARVVLDDLMESLRTDLRGSGAESHAPALRQALDGVEQALDGLMRGAEPLLAALRQPPAAAEGMMSAHVERLELVGQALARLEDRAREAQRSELIAQFEAASRWRALETVLAALAVAVIAGITLCGLIMSVHASAAAREAERQTIALRASEERFRQLSAASPVGIFLSDATGGYLYVNPRWERLAGRAGADSHGDGWLFAVHPEDRAAVGEAWAATVSGGKDFAHDFRMVNADPAVRWVQARACPLPGPDGRTSGWVGTVEDIGERREVESQLRRAKEDAEAAAQLKAEFLATMSHEIRTPMNGVIGMTSLLLDAGLNGEQREYAETIRNSGEALLAVINDILDFSKIEAGKIDLEIVDFDVRTAVAEVVELLAGQAHAKGLELASYADPEVPAFVRGDPGRLRQVLLNLLGNAVKFTQAGEVVATVSQAETDPGSATCLLRFEVRDTGIGIPRESTVRLFEPFSQLDSSTTRKFGGTGLGLVISKRLAELMGGEIGVESEPGKGSTFWFTIRFERAAGADTGAAPDPDRLAGCRVLVVDDNATNRTILERQLTAWRCAVVSATDGGEALAQLRSAVRAGRPLEIAILDMHMPGMDGLDLALAITGDPGLSGTRLVMLSSLGQHAIAASARQAGIEAYLTKPVRLSRLLQTLVGLVAGSSPAVRETQASRAVAPSPEPSHGRILVAEDNAVNQRLALRMLAKLGYRADGVGNGREALEAVERVPYDVVLMDCQMPEMDGFEAVRQLRRRETASGHRRLAVIALTANAMHEDRQRCLRAGMDDYLPKPVTLAALGAMLRRWSPGREAARAASPLG